MNTSEAPQLPPDAIPFEDLDALNDRLEKVSPEDRIRWALETWGDDLVLSTSFGVQSALMLHLATTIKPDIRVVFIDTGYLFPETYRFADELTKRLNLDLRTYQAEVSPARQEALRGKLWEQDKEGLEEYNFVRKVEPMNRAITELGARGWLAGLRRVQSSTREDLGVVEPQNKITKVYPVIDWTEKQVYDYLVKHDLPYHPLFDQGYVSVGDWHSSAPLTPGQSAEDTRFGGIKRECGLHELSGRIDFQI